MFWEHTDSYKEAGKYFSVYELTHNSKRIGGEDSPCLITALLKIKARTKKIQNVVVA